MAWIAGNVLRGRSVRFFSLRLTFVSRHRMVGLRGCRLRLKANSSSANLSLRSDLIQINADTHLVV